jgi:hypothetical protein
MNDEAVSATSQSPPPSASYARLEDGLAAAHAAYMRGDLPTALEIWAELQAQYPHHPTPLHRAASALLSTRHLDEAENLLATGRDRFPTDPAIAADFAWAAWSRNDYQTAVERWAYMRDVS